MNKKRKTKFKNKRLMFLFIISAVVVGYALFFLCYNFLGKIISGKEELFLASDTNIVNLYDMKFEEIKSISRGQKVMLNKKDIIKDEANNSYYKIVVNGIDYYVSTNNIATNEKGIVMEKEIYVKTPVNLLSPTISGKLLTLVKKEDKLTVLGFDSIDVAGQVKNYLVKVNNTEGLISSNYVAFDQETATLHYEPEKYYDIHYNRGNAYGGGHAGNLDYYPTVKPIFEDNVMPDPVYALYLNSTSNVISNVDSYIELAKDTKINAFVVDIKDDRMPGYKSKVMETYSPTNYKYANNSFDNYKQAITKLKEAGYYVIGRITTFKDSHYAKDHLEHAILTTTGEIYSSGWPSPYQRSVWEFNVELAKEAVTEMGFNEIQFDYVRFPDRVSNKNLNLKNTYNEEKAEAIQRFLRYATDELHKLKVYVSADVFGESAHNYVTAYGQYWAAISNIVDVISGMPYPDHFNKYEYGFNVPVWSVPYDLLNYWGKNYVMKRQAEIPTPAKLRTWVQAYNTIHEPYLDYNAPELEAQIKGLFDAGLKNGYMTWNSASNLSKYKLQKEAFKKDYK